MSKAVRLGRWRRLGWPLIVRCAVFVTCALLIVALWFIWHSPSLSRPPAGPPGRLSFGMSDAPSDTRVFFNITPWSPGKGHTVRLVLGQSATKNAKPVSFRLEIDGFLATPEQPCAGAATEHTCTADDGVGGGPPAVREVDGQRPATSVIVGTFDPGGGTFVNFTPTRLGAASNGPYRSFYTEIFALDSSGTATDRSLRNYPARGIEVEISSDVGSDRTRYESFFPTQPYRIYADGWAWSVPAPGSPLGSQLVDIETESQLRSRSEVAALFMGVLLALMAQALYETLHNIRAIQTDTSPPGTDQTPQTPD